MKRFTPSDLALIGGQYDVQIADSRLFGASWAQCSEAMEYVVLDTARLGVHVRFTSEIDLEPLWDDMLRLHVFGAGGDLMWRRDGNTAYWRYVGPPGPELSAEFPFEDYWVHHPELTELIADEERPLRALLWGQYDSRERRWHEDRVGKATVENRLLYPVWEPSSGNRVEMLAVELRHPEGTPIAAVWTYAFEIVTMPETVEA